MPYGFIELPFDIKELQKQQEIKVQSQSTTKFTDKLRNAWYTTQTAGQMALKNPSQTFQILGAYLNDPNIKNVVSPISNTVNAVTTKFSGIAIAQLLVDGKITSKSALDYLFLGVAPALNQVGIALGYSGLNQLKNAMTNGTLNVGQFISGLSKVLKGIYDEAKINGLINESNNNNNRIYFDMTMSDNSNYQSETPDRRTENGNDLSEFCHNLPPTFDVQAELQDGKKYSKEEFRELFVNLRERRIPITLYLGEEHFNSLILQGFNPSGQGSQKSGFEYNLNFKQINAGSVEEIEIEAFATAPKLITNDDTSVSSGTKSIAGKKSINTSNTKTPDTLKGKNSNVKQERSKAHKIKYGTVANNTKQADNLIKWGIYSSSIK